MASPPPNPNEGEEGSEFKEEPSGERAAAPQKTYVAPPVSQLPTKLQYVALGAPGPSGSIKQCFRTVKAARRVPTLPRKTRPDEGGGAAAGPSAAPPAPEPERRARRDRSKRHICTTCDKRFSSPGKLSQHVLSHTGELPFSCDLCDKRFNSKFKLVRHSLIHSEERAFACTVCGKTFNRKDHLTNHIRVHNPVKKLYTCERPDCRKSYTSLLSYRKHAALHSAEEGNLQCKICDETFSSRQDIVYHLKVHTGSRTVKNETDKKFTCDYCERRFFTAKDVRRHLVVHTGRRDFLCPYCPQKFGRKDHLVRHVKNAHPDESWKSAAVGTSKDPPPETTTFEEKFVNFPIEGTDFTIWKTSSPKESTSEGPTRVPSSDIIVEMPPDLPDLDIKVEPLDIDIKLEEPTSPSCELLEYPVVYMVPPYAQTPSDLPYMTSQPLTDPIDTHLLDPSNVQSLLMDPGEGPSGLSSQMLGLLEERAETPAFSEEVSRPQQRLPAFTQAFHTAPRAQSPKPPPPPPPPPH
ncbi:zinc finger protein PLAG1-like [Pectinophora gossypiella]|uniref:zinc finger protein PLAG1-like n=1 Tax=Pectinophora gossypiella TaxID=13191 RepID=UPI00214E0468|nr:zinc finger protein PLAG1-like [Pectinophora gossypiella]